MNRYLEAVKILETHRDELMNIPGVEGSGIGKENGEAIIIVFTSKRDTHIQPVFHGIKTKVKFTGVIKAL